MLPYQRSYHITTLVDKLKYWLSPDAKKEFYPNLAFKPPVGIQVVENGYYYISDNYVAYNDVTNGLIVRIKENADPIHWKCFSDLYNESSKSKTITTDQPSFQDFIEIEDKGTWEYCEIKSPNGQYGLNLNDELFDNSFTFSDPDNKDKYLDPSWQAPQMSADEKNKKQIILESYIDQLSILMNEMYKISTKNNCGFPKFENRLISCLYRDSNGYFWSDIDQFEWNSTPGIFIEAALEEFSLVTKFANRCGLITGEMHYALYQKAREKWLTV